MAIALESVPAVRAGSWTQLMEELYRDSWDPALQRHRSPVIFRGMSSAADTLESTLVRLAGPRASVAKLESHLLRNFTKYAKSAAVTRENVWNWLALAAHHGLPTRLIDWTYSPLVAAHFATVNLDGYADDGVIWCLHHRVSNRLLPSRLRQELAEVGADVFTAETLTRSAPSLDSLEKLSPEPFLLLLEPPSLDDRIVNQFALFSLMSAPDRSLQDWLAQHPSLCRRIIIPAGLKWEVRDKLDQAGVTERVLFPGLDGLAAWLARYYTPRACGSVPEHPHENAEIQVQNPME